MRLQVVQDIIDLMRLKKLHQYLNFNPNIIRLVINIISLYSPKGICAAKNKFLQLAGVKMGRDVSISGNVTIHEPHNLEMGTKSFLGQNTVLYCWDKVCIGDYTFMGPNNVFVAGGHNTETFESEVKPIKIGKGCWIGANCTFLGGGKVGNGCIVSAGSVVLGKEYPPFSIIAGVPAKVVKPRKYPDKMRIPGEYDISELFEGND